MWIQFKGQTKAMQVAAWWTALQLLTLVGHGDGVVRVVGAHVVDDDRRGVATRRVADFLPEGAVPRGDQRHPGDVVRRDGEPDVNVATLSVPKEGGQQDEPAGFLLRGVLAVATALGLVGPQLRGGGVHVGDVDERRVPLLLLGHRELQAQRGADAAQRQQAGGQRDAPAGCSAGGRCHCSDTESPALRRPSRRQADALSSFPLC